MERVSPRPARMVDTACSFRFDHYQDILRSAQAKGYRFYTMHGYTVQTPDRSPVMLLRHDIETRIDRAVAMAELEAAAGIQATYFVRVHANEYNPFGYQGYRALRRVRELGHEIGLHAEPVDFASICSDDPISSLRRAKHVLETILDSEVHGVATHGDFTPYNNLEIWSTATPEAFGFSYQAYARTFMDRFVYVSDSNVDRWKSYAHGQLTDSAQCACQYVERAVPFLYVLTHGKNWYWESVHTG